MESKFLRGPLQAARVILWNRVLLLGSRWARNFVRRAFPRNAHAVQCPSNFWSISPPRHRECQTMEAWTKEQAFAGEMIFCCRPRLCQALWFEAAIGIVLVTRSEYSVLTQWLAVFHDCFLVEPNFGRPCELQQVVETIGRGSMPHRKMSSVGDQ